MAEDKLIVIGGSAGSLAQLLRIVGLFRRDMNVSVMVVMHRMPAAEDDVLAEVLTARTSCEVKEVDDKDDLRPGVIYIAPPDYHVLVEKNRSFTLDDSEKVNFSRPSIDVTFESASEVFGSSLVCVLLSGANADGVAGLVKAKKNGSTIIIQDPASAEFAFMPQRAMDEVTPHLVLSEENLGKIIDFL